MRDTDRPEREREREGGEREGGERELWTGIEAKTMMRFSQKHCI